MLKLHEIMSSVRTCEVGLLCGAWRGDTERNILLVLASGNVSALEQRHHCLLLENSVLLHESDAIISKAHDSVHSSLRGLSG